MLFAFILCEIVYHYVILSFKMFRCYLCERRFEHIDPFIHHFSLLHVFETCNSYICMQNDCYRIFQNLKLFKNHLIADHSKGNEKSSNLRIQPVAELAVSDNDSDNGNFDVSASDSFICEDEFICNLDNVEGNLIDLRKQLRMKLQSLHLVFIMNCQ